MHKVPENSRNFAVIGGCHEGDAAGQPTGSDRKAAPGTAEEAGKALGRLVRSEAGHDREALLVIVGIADDNHVLLADGKLRKAEKPKKKKLRHVKVTEYFSGELNQKLLSGSPVQNAELRRFIAACEQRERENTTGKEE